MTPLSIIETLIDAFYEAEHNLELVYGMTPIDPREGRTTNLPYFDQHICEEQFEKFQKIYNDLSNLMHEIKDES